MLYLLYVATLLQWILRILFVLTNGTAAGDADYTTTNVTVTVPAGATTGISVPTTADTIDGKMKLYHCFWNCFGYWNHYR
jgi:hypothetical protein